ncbi:hypothetical protein [Vannielia litorea]|uniref:Uncharacterized protein n=1 Tax=Vannielia litorea TaxID=1217970 RepID=A0A1N6FSN4_9RHOB|nr:hypothetical protein [Vannielia litorea]SIN98201.1 hypothetical protein SAMN05444002_1919 [Vannielia litorea]
MKRLLALSLALAGLSAGPVDAAGKTVDCYCTDTQGSRVELGEQICLTVGGRSFTAQCQMSLNVPMWREIRPNCLSSSLLPRPVQPRQSSAPASSG